MARLSIGVDVQGVTKLHALETALNNVGAQAEKLDKALATTKGKIAGAFEFQELKALNEQLSKLGREGSAALKQVSSGLTDTGGLAKQLKEMTGASYAWRSEQEALYHSAYKLNDLHDAHISKLATMKALETEGAQAVVAHTRAIDERNSAMKRLQSLGVRYRDADDALATVRALDSLETRMAARAKEIATLRKENAKAVETASKQEETARRNVIKTMEDQFFAQRKLDEQNRSATEKVRRWYEIGSSRLEVGAGVAADKQAEQLKKHEAQMTALSNKYREWTESRARWFEVGRSKLEVGSEVAADKQAEQLKKHEAQMVSLASKYDAWTKAKARWYEVGRSKLEVGSEVAADSALRSLESQMQARLKTIEALKKQAAKGTETELEREIVNRKKIASSIEEQFFAQQKLKEKSGSIKASPLNTGDYEGFAATLGKVDSATRKVTNSTDLLTKAKRSLHDATRGVSGAMGSLWMTYGQIVPLMAGFAAAAGTLKTIKLGSDFDYAVRSIEILAYGYETLSQNADLANVSLAGTKEAILGIVNTPFSPGQLAEGMLEFSRAGFKEMEQNVKNLDQASKFAYIGQMDLSRAIELVVGQMTAFRDVGGDAGVAYNTMAVVADRTSINLQQMAEAFKNTTSLGTVMGLEFQDVAVAIGVLGQAGIRGATAGAALNTMMYKLIAPTETAKKKMDALGIAFEAFDKAGNIKSIKQISFELADLTKNLKPNQAAEVFESMVGLRGVKALGALVNMAKTGADEFNKLSAAVRGSGSYLDGYFALLEKSGKVQIDLLKAEFDKLFTANYDNSSVVSAIKNLREVVGSEGMRSALASITSLVVGLTAAVGKMLTLDPAAFAGGLGVIGLILGSNPITAAAVTGLALLQKAKEFVEWFNKSSVNKLDFAAGVMGEFGGEIPGLEERKNQLKELEAATRSASKSVAEAKAELAGISLKQSDSGFTAEDLDRIGKVEDYFTQIQDKILEINRTPLQIVDRQIEEGIADMWSKLSEGTKDLNEQAAITAKYVEDLKKLGSEGQVAAGRIADLRESLNAEKDEGKKGLIKQIIADLTELQRALHAKEIEKATKAMLADMRKEWQGYAKEVKKIQDDLAKSQRDLAKELRSIDQGSKKGYDLWTDQKKEATEYEQQAVKVLQNIKKLSEEFAATQAKLQDPGLDPKSRSALMDELRLTAEKMKELSAGPLKEYLGDMVGAAKSLNTEVNGVTSGMEKSLDAAQKQLSILQAQKAINEASGYSTSNVDAQIKRQEALVKVLEAQKQIQEGQVKVSAQAGAQVAKDFLNKGQAMSKEAADILSRTLGEMMKQLGSDASKLGMGPVDMTEGMDATSAAWIKKWQETTDAASQSTKKSVDEIQARIGEIRMPTEEWLTSIFTMKGVFVEAVDEMSRKVEAGGRVKGTGTIYTNAIPGKNPIVDNAAAQAAAIMSQLEAERNKNIAAAAQAASAAGQTQAAAIEAGAQRGAQYMQQGIVTGASEATTETRGNFSGGGIDEAINKVNELKAEIDRLTDQSTWDNIDWMAAFADMPDSLQAESYFETIKESLLDMTDYSDEFVESWEKGWEDTDKASKEVMSSIIDRLDYITSKTFYVDIEYRENRSIGGLIGGFQLGGYIQKLAEGGGVRNMLQGAYLPGYGGGDRRLILGEDGEFMIRKEMVRAAGRDVADDFNHGKWGRVIDKLSNRFSVPRMGLTGYAGGGYIQAGLATSSSDQSYGQTQVVMNFEDTKETAVMYGTPNDVGVFTRAMARKSRLRSA